MLRMNINTYKALNPKYKEIDKQKMLEYAKESIVKEIIKKNELKKYFDFSVNELNVSRCCKKFVFKPWN